MNYVAELFDLHKTFKNSTNLGLEGSLQKVLHGIHLKIPAKLTTALVGESGSGKTTLARCLIRLHTIDMGKILLQGQDITQIKGKKLRQLRRHMQMIFQDPFSALNPRLTVHEILQEPLRAFQLGAKSEQQAAIAKMLNNVGLDTHAGNKFPHAFSGGQRQRIVIARALMPNPALVIADEPVSALDVSVQSQILNLLKDLQQEFSTAYLFISHNLAVVQHMAHYVVILYQGRVVEQGSTTSIFKEAQHPYTINLLRAAPRFTAHSNSMADSDFVPMRPASKSLKSSGCPYLSRCPKAAEICAHHIPSLEHHGKGQPDHLSACHFA